MLFALYVEGVLFFKGVIFQGEDYFVDFVEEYEANHIGEVAITFYDEDDDKHCLIQFDSYESYLTFENALNSEE